TGSALFMWLADAKGRVGRPGGGVGLLLLARLVCRPGLIISLFSRPAPGAGAWAPSLLPGLGAAAGGPPVCAPPRRRRAPARRGHGCRRHAARQSPRTAWARRDAGAAQEPSHGGSHHQGRAASAGVLGAGAWRAGDGP